MKKPDLPPDESHRLAALHALQVLDSEAEPLFDALVSAASRLAATPVALISLVDGQRQWFKANQGLPDCSETPREQAFCAHAILQREILEIGDATRDPRFAANPLVVGAPAIRFYAGAPIIIDGGHAIGTLCVIDYTPRHLSDAQREGLRDLARAAGEALQTRLGALRANAERDLRERALQTAERDRRRLANVVRDTGAATFEWTRQMRWPWLSVRLRTVLGTTSPRLRLAACLARVHRDDRAGLREQLCAHLANGLDEFEYAVRIVDAAGAERHVSLRWHVTERDAQQRPLRIFGTLVDHTTLHDVERALHRSRAHQRETFERAPVMLHSIDGAGRIAAVSEHWLAVLGYRREEVIGRLSTDFLTPASREYAESVALPAFYREGRAERVPLEWVCSDGRVIDVELSSVLERDESGATRTLTVLHDVTALRRAKAQLRASEAFLERVGRVAGVGGWELDIASGRLNWTEETWRLHQLDNVGGAPPLQSAIEFYAPEGRAIIEKAVERGMQHGEPWDLELPFVGARGRRFWVRAVGMPEFVDGKLARLVGAFQDIDQRKRMEEALGDSHEMLRVTLQSIGDAVLTTDANGFIRWLNPAAERMTGWNCGEAVGRPIEQVFNIVNEETRLPAPNPIRTCLQQGITVGLASNTALIARNGTDLGIEDSAAPIFDRRGTIIGGVLVFHDVTEQRRLSREMSHRAQHDALTGLINRQEFELRLASRVAADDDETDVQAALLYVDLDQFKIVNDSCGHSAGDALLGQIADILRGCVRANDVVARLGGDEFAVLLEHCARGPALRIAEQICQQLEGFRFEHDGNRFRVGASIGLVSLPGEFDSVEALMNTADLCCIAAKEAGRNRVHVWSGHDRDIEERNRATRWATRIDHALDEDRFELFAQRIVPLNDASPQALYCEVLLRMRDEEGRLLTPGSFIAAAERFFMATRIDQWVLGRVVALLHGDAGLTDVVGRLCVNVSAQSVCDRAFHRYAEELLAGAGRVAQQLCFEITETVAVTRVADAVAFVERMRALGAHVALDDFGAGASSFGYLKHMPVDVLKIDGQFVRDVVDDPLDAAAVRCFQDVARVVGVRTVAECVETEAVRSELARIGVDAVQGFLLHRPEPLDDLIARECAKRRDARGVMQRIVPFADRPIIPLEIDSLPG